MIFDIDKLNAVAMEMEGKPFVEHGRDIARGLSCMGLVLEIYRRFGIALCDPLFDEDAAALQWEAMRPHDFYPITGDVLGLDMKGLGYVGHVVLYLGGGKIIHSAVNAGVKIESASLYLPKLKYIYRYNVDLHKNS